MTYVTWKIERYPFNTADSTWSTTAITLTQYSDPIVQLSTGDARDSFSFKVLNFNDTFSNYFKPNDKLVISRAINTTTVASSDLLIVGSVQNTPEEETATQTQVRVEGNNFSEAMLSGIVFFDPAGAVIPTAIQSALNSVGNYNANFLVTWNSLNPTTKSTGGAFPAVTEKWFNRPIKDFITKYSTNDATGDGNYYWYVDKDNKLVWAQKSGTANYTFSAATNTYTRLRINKDLKDVKNWVIVKGGTDPEGSPIQIRVQDMSSVSRNGLKPYILTSITKSAEMLVKQDKDYFGVTDMKDASYPLTPTWTASSQTNYPTYVASLRTFVKAQCEVEGNAFLRGKKFGKLKIDLSFIPGTVSWGRGSLVSCTIPSLGTDAKNLRVTDIQYSSDEDVFTLSEDEGTL